MKYNVTHSLGFNNTEKPISGELTTVSNHDKMKQKRTEIDMSLILAVKCIDGIVFCADSKGTRFDIGKEAYYHEEGRIITKVFNADTFIFGTFGINELVKNGVRYKIEDVIQRIMTKKPSSASAFCELMRKEALQLSESFASGQFRLNFVFGYKDSNGFGYTIRFVELANEQQYDKHSFYNPNDYAMCFGASEFISSSFCNAVKNGMTVDEAASLLPGIMEALVYIGDSLLKYNPIGLPCKVVKLS